MPRLIDRTYAPSFLGSSSAGLSTPGALMTMSDSVLRVGEVVKVLSPSNPDNSNGNEYEYVVRVSRRDDGGPIAQEFYTCLMSDGFGSKGDHYRRSMRPVTQDETGVSISDGAIVLVACINADKSRAVILSCLRQPNRTDKDPEGQFLTFEFNGVSVKIADDGGMALTIPGATDNVGKPRNRDDNNHGTSVKIEANGNFTVDDHNGESIRISPGDKIIEVKTNEQKTTVQSTWTLKAQTVTVVADEINLGGSRMNLNPMDGVVVGSGIDSFTGVPYFALGSTSSTVKVKK